MFDHPAATVATEVFCPEALSSNREQIISNDARAGMRRAVFHRKSKQAPPMSPIQFVMSMHLKNAAMKIAGDMPMTEPAMAVGYISACQFSEFKYAYGQSPRRWSDPHHRPVLQ